MNVKMYFLGYYGRPPAPVDPEIAKKVVGDEEPIPAGLVKYWSLV